MPGINLDTIKDQKEKLFDLLKLQKDNAGYKVKGLSTLIIKQMAIMDEKDVAYVEKKIAELEE